MIKSLLGDDDDSTSASKPAPDPSAPTSGTLGLFDSSSEESSSSEPYVLSQSEPESAAETIRRSGLAWSAGIAFFAAVIFMLIVGWGADLLLGSSPWGKVGGIVLGSIIGFVQFFRLTSQIFKK